MTRVVIMGAAGRDYHDFNVVFRDDPSTEVVAFTATESQNLGEIGEHEREYPAELAGPHYDEGIPIRPEAELEALIREYDVDTVVFSYSDVSHGDVMHAASRALAQGADFRIVGPDEMMLDLDAPVVAVDAVRTGCGKSQASCALTDALQDRGLDVAVVREPMPYGDLVEERVRRFETKADLDEASVTIEEREEYEQHIEREHVVYAGVDYADVFAAAQAEADVVLWDGGNNELPFARPDFHLVLADPLRAGHERRYHPGETNLRIADAVLVNKENSASEDQVRTVVENVREVNPDADIYHADSVVSVEDPELVEGKRALVVEDGPTLTHGGTEYGAATVAAKKYDAECLEPREGAVGTVADALEKYDHHECVLPAMGYNDQQIRDLEETIRNVDPEIVLSGTPHDLSRVVDIDVPIVRVRYDISLHDETFASLLDRYVERLGLVNAP